MKIIKGDLVLKENTIIDDDLKVQGHVRCEGGYWNLTCGDLDCHNLVCHNIDCNKLDCHNLDCNDIDCHNLVCHNLVCYNLVFYTIAIAYTSFKCKSWKARRDNYVIKCLNGEIEIKDKKICDKCGAELEE